MADTKYVKVSPIILMANGSIVEDDIKFAQNAKQRLVQIALENTIKVLHYNNNEDSDVNIYHSYDYKE
jgi:GR25 family glycosyltransferase involved in LPS biosynthesis